MANALKMPFAEWLAKMADCGLASAGRVIAIYAAVFDITTNGELAAITGIEGRSLDKWKRLLVANGWVIIPRCEGGRGRGIEVIPAYRETPVSFTDIKSKNPRKYYPRNFVQTPAEIAGVSEAETPAEIAPLSVETPAKTTGVSSRAEEYNNINLYNNINNLPKVSNNITHTLEQVTARAGEEHAGNGVFVNCETIRHKDFSISLKGIELQLCGAVPMNEIKAVALGHALQWALDLESGKRNVVPSNTASFIRGSIQNQRNNQAVTDVRKTRASGGDRYVKTDGKTESEWERISRLTGEPKPKIEILEPERRNR